MLKFVTVGVLVALQASAFAGNQIRIPAVGLRPPPNAAPDTPAGPPPVKSPGKLTISTTYLEFGEVGPENPANPQLVQIRNTGELPLVLTIGMPAAPFVLGSSTCASTLAGGATCSLAVSFVPTALGFGQSGEFSILSDGGEGAIQLSGASVINLVQRSGYRAWSNGTYAATCEAYRRPAGMHHYSGSAGNGIYRIHPATLPSPLDAYCDMTDDDGGWTLVAAIVPNTNAHAFPEAVGTLTAPVQAATAKLSDSMINAIPKIMYRANGTNGQLPVYFDTSDSFASNRQVYSKASATLEPVWEGPFIGGAHRGFNTFAISSFNRSDAALFVYTGANSVDDCRLGAAAVGPSDWCGPGVSAAVWVR